MRPQSDGVTGGPHAEPLLGAPILIPLHLGEPQLRRETHRAFIGTRHSLEGSHGHWYWAVSPSPDSRCSSHRLTRARVNWARGRPAMAVSRDRV